MIEYVLKFGSGSISMLNESEPCKFPQTICIDIRCFFDVNFQIANNRLSAFVNSCENVQEEHDEVDVMKNFPL